MARPPRNPLIPTRDGVSPSCVAVPTGAWPTVLDFLAERLDKIPRAQWAQRLAQGQVFQENGQTIAAHQPCPQGQRLYYYRSLASEPALPVQASIVFEDDHLLVADKPHFMPVTPTGRYVQQSLLVQLKRQTGCDELTPIHRIDRETAGLVVLSKRPQDRNAYQALFRARQVHKVYHAVASDPGDLQLPRVHRSRMAEDPAQFFRMYEVPGEPNSETRVSVLHIDGNQALYQLEPVTGKRHQLRVHMLSLGRPIEGDQFYPAVLRGPDQDEDFSQPLQLLAHGMAFTDPHTGQARVFESGLRLSL
jgi:tRNA pseudouridine32 synthase / 23S rRNA pseudouridine746 synthase